MGCQKNRVSAFAWFYVLLLNRLFILVLTMVSFASPAQQLIDAGESEVLYFFSYKSPGSHAMVNSVAAFEMVHDKYDMPGKMYRIPYVSDDIGLRMAAIAYFMLKMDADSLYSLAEMEVKAYEVFKSLNITTEDELVSVLQSHVFGHKDPVYLKRLLDDAKVMLRSTVNINQEVTCSTLPCTRLSSSDDFKLVTLKSSSNSVKEYWENVSLSLSAISANQ